MALTTPGFEKHAQEFRQTLEEARRRRIADLGVVGVLRQTGATLAARALEELIRSEQRVLMDALEAVDDCQRALKL